MRGSTPCHAEEVTRYGGNTSSVSVSAPGNDPVLFDLGTGVRYFGLAHPPDQRFKGSCLLSHLHWDHVQGLPFFTPLLRTGAELDVYAPSQGNGRTVSDVMTDTIQPPLFPITLAELPGEIRFHDIADSEFAIGEFDVMSRLVPHIGRTCGYRVTWQGHSISYLSDHQQPSDGSFTASDAAMSLCEAADVLIHDAQYTRAEYEERVGWGHSSVEHTWALAAQAGVGRLVTFHHDPSHGDGQLDALVAELQARDGPHVIGGTEGLQLTI